MKVKLRLPNVEDFMVSGSIPLPVIEKLQARGVAVAANGDKPEPLTQEEMTFAVELDRAVLDLPGVPAAEEHFQVVIAKAVSVVELPRHTGAFVLGRSLAVRYNQLVLG